MISGDDLTDLAAEGRFMTGNLCARTNCTVVTTDERVIFTKNPHPNFRQHAADEAPHFS